MIKLNKYPGVDVVLWTNMLRGIYEKHRSRTALEYVVFCASNMWSEAEEIGKKIDTSLAPSQWYHLRGPMKELQRYKSRLLYYHHYLPKGGAEVKENVVDPLLYGRWPLDFPEQISEPQWIRGTYAIEGRPDITQVAMIRNQMVAGIMAFEDLWVWWNDITPTNRMGELIMEAKREAFEKSAPGEPPTVRDRLSDAIDKMKSESGKILRQFGAAGAAGAYGVALLGAGMLVSYLTGAFVVKEAKE